MVRAALLAALWATMPLMGIGAGSVHAETGAAAHLAHSVPRAVVAPARWYADTQRAEVPAASEKPDSLDGAEGEGDASSCHDGPLHATDARAAATRAAAANGARAGFVQELRLQVGPGRSGDTRAPPLH